MLSMMDNFIRWRKNTSVGDWLDHIPSPFVLFLIFSCVLAIVSLIGQLAHWQVQTLHSNEIIQVRNVISSEGLVYFLTHLVDNFVRFIPLGPVFCLMLGIGLLEKTGCLATFMQLVILRTPKRLMIPAIFLVGMIGSLAADAAFIIIPPLAGIIFYQLKRPPIVGILAGYAAVAGGFSANFLITPLDIILAGISTQAVQMVDESITVTAISNWYFICFSVVLLMIVGSVVTTRFIEPKFQVGKHDVKIEKLEGKDIRALTLAGITLIALIMLIMLLVLPPSSAFRNSAGGLVPSPFLKSMNAFSTLVFMFVAIVYGVSNGKIKSMSDIINMLNETVRELAPVLVLFFMISQFIGIFQWTNIGEYIAHSGAEHLSIFENHTLVLIALFILFSAGLNLCISSGSTQWALMAPIFIPMFSLLQYDPAFIQMAYRIGDSATNVISPVSPFLPIALTYIQKYDPTFNFGKLIATMLPYAMSFLVVWSVTLVLWGYFNLPLGPGI